jgi:hypothetical protein
LHGLYTIYILTVKAQMQKLCKQDGRYFRINEFSVYLFCPLESDRVNEYSYFFNYFLQIGLSVHIATAI